MPAIYPEKKLTIIGGGMIGLMEAYFAYLKARDNNEKIRITVYEKNESFNQTTSAKIAPSLTPDEILAVVPRGAALVEKLKILFSEPGGIRVDDVDDVNDSAIAAEFIRAVEMYSKDEAGHQERTERLLAFGKKSMELWEHIYDTADNELKEILIASNFNPCREPKNKDNTVLHDGYRIDLIQRIPNAAAKAEDMKKDYESLGYKNCSLLSPKEVMKRDPSLTDFCRLNSEEKSEELVWKNDAVALWRPGGCLDAQTFLPKFATYLSKVMGQYNNEDNQVKNNFKFKLNRCVTAASSVEDKGCHHVNGLMLSGSYTGMKRNKHAYRESEYVFCPGESVGTLRKLGFDEPAYAVFAGASLKLNIPVSAELLEKCKSFNHCMEVHQEGVVLAWQARVLDGKIFIGVAGTKAFYGDKPPRQDQAFAQNRTLLQLNIVNTVLPGFISVALGRNTEGQILTETDMKVLEQKGIAKRDVGSRAVAYDNVPMLGRIFKAGTAVENARVTTGLGSGGVSFAPAAVQASQSANTNQPDPVLAYASSKRKI